MKPIKLKFGTPQPAFPHHVAPDDDPLPGDRCKTCGEDITWIGPSNTYWEHISDPEPRQSLNHPAESEFDRITPEERPVWGMHWQRALGTDLHPGADRGLDTCPCCGRTRWDHFTANVPTETFGWTCERAR